MNTTPSSAFTNSPSIATLTYLRDYLRSARLEQAERELAAQRLTAAYGVATDDTISFELADGGARELSMPTSVARTP